MYMVRKHCYKCKTSTIWHEVDLKEGANASPYLINIQCQTCQTVESWEKPTVSHKPRFKR